MGTIRLEENAKVAVIGAGPAGAFFSQYLLALAKERGMRLEVVMYDRKDFRIHGPRGCNMCAGVIGRNLLERMMELGMNFESVIQRRIDGYMLLTRWDSVYLRKAPDAEICTFYRGSGPRVPFETSEINSLDQYLLSRAVALGALLRKERVTTISRYRSGKISVACDASRDEFDFVVCAHGVNSAMTERLHNLGIGYAPPGLWQAAQMEIALPAEYITERFHDRIVVLVPGMHTIKFITIIPKRDHVTLCALGKKVTREDLLSVLGHHMVSDFLPAQYNVSCMCFPRMPVSSPQKPYGDRLVVIGDASFSRYMKNGIESAFITSTLAAGTAMNVGIDEESFRKHYYGMCLKIFEKDNRYGRFLFFLNDVVSRVGLFSRAHLNLVKREAKNGKRRLSTVLWNIFTGDERYATVFRECLDSALCRDLLKEVAAELFHPAGRRAASDE